MNIQLKKSDFGFTLIELMTVMAIIGILASAIMISLGVQKKRAIVNRVLTEMSGVMENIYLCKSDDGVINHPNSTGGNSICDISSNYGVWPDVSESVLGNGTGFSISVTGDLNSGNWAYWAKGTDTEIVCCNSKSGKCGKLDSGSLCDMNTDIK